MKLNGVGKGGIICLFVGSGISLVASLIILLAGLAGFSFGLHFIAGSYLIIFAIISMILPFLVIIFGAMAMVKGSNGLKIACGVLGLISIIFVWVAWVFPAILALVGGILALCGKFENSSEARISPPENLKFEELQQ